MLTLPNKFNKRRSICHMASLHSQAAGPSPYSRPSHQCARPKTVHAPPELTPHQYSPPTRTHASSLPAAVPAVLTSRQYSRPMPPISHAEAPMHHAHISVHAHHHVHAHARAPTQPPLSRHVQVHYALYFEFDLWRTSVCFASAAVVNLVRSPTKAACWPPTRKMHAREHAHN